MVDADQLRQGFGSGTSAAPSRFDSRIRLAMCSHPPYSRAGRNWVSPVGATIHYDNRIAQLSVH